MSRPIPGGSFQEVNTVEEVEYKREPVRGYEEYSIDTDGIVYSKNGKPLKFSINHGGYCIVNFLISGVRKGFSVHSLVAKQFLNEPDTDKTQVNHKDGVKINNSLSNLEWVTPKENMRHRADILGYDNAGSNNSRAKAISAYNNDNGKKVFEMKSLADAARYIAHEHNVSFQSANIGIWRAACGKRKSYKNLTWKYI